jgi:hypothetical protein
MGTTSHWEYCAFNVFGGRNMLTQYQINKENEYQQFKSELLTESTLPCDFKVGDFVTFTNEYGVFFRKPKKVIGFAGQCDLPDRFIFTESDAYWFPKKPDQLNKVETTDTGCLIVREVTQKCLYGFEMELLEAHPNWARLMQEDDLHCVWRNKDTMELVTYCEGDVIWATALDMDMLFSESARVIIFTLDNM